MNFPQITTPRLHHVTEGEGAAVLLLHGLLMSSHDWYKSGLVAETAKSHRVICPDLLAHGGSPKSTDSAAYEQRNQAAGIVALMDQMGLERAQVVGYSAGAWLALGLAKYYPERLSSLVIGGWDIINGLPSGPEGPLSFDVFLDFARRTAPHVSQWVKPEDEPSLRESFEALWVNQDISAALQALPVPILLWAGRDDIYYSSLKSYSEDTGFELLSSEGDHVSTMLEMDSFTREHLRKFLDTHSG